MKRLLWFNILMLSIQFSGRGAENVAANAINSLGIDLLRQTKSGQNTVLSPYSIQCAMAMAYEGADETTRAEMGKVLHYPEGDEVRKELSEIREFLQLIGTKTPKEIAPDRKTMTDSIIIATANRLFGQIGYDFQPAYVSLLKNSYGAPFEPLDFRSDSAGATKQINSWVAEQTKNKIRDLIPQGALDGMTRLVLVNAIYLKMSWSYPFKSSATEPAPFHLADGKDVEVPTMQQTKNFGYEKVGDFAVVVLPYRIRSLQFVILVPDKRNGVDSLERELSPELLKKCIDLQHQEIILHFPKFKLTPPAISLKQRFESLGMKKAFNIPAGSANFGRIAPQNGKEPLYISDIFHKTFVDVDEKGTEAAAATAVMVRGKAKLGEMPQPVEVRVDHPFLFAIQHRETGACLFLGRVMDPSKN